jgi:hypothetical protein
MASAKQNFEGYSAKVSRPEFSFKDFQDFYRDYLKHQYELLNHRTNWFIAINAFLLGTLGFSIQKRAELSLRTDSNVELLKSTLATIDSFSILLSLLGIALALITPVLLSAAARPIYRISHLFKQLGEQLNEPPSSGPDEVSAVAVDSKDSNDDIKSPTTVPDDQPSTLDFPLRGRLPYVIGGLSRQTYGPGLTTFIPFLFLAFWAFLLLQILGIVDVFGTMQTIAKRLLTR